MAKQKESRLFNGNPDRLAEGFLHEYVFDPEANKDPSEYKIFKSKGYTLRSWRDEFYVWRGGCYYRLSNAEMKRLITKHIQALNDTVIDEESEISISTQRVNNIFLCLKGRVGIEEDRELKTWDDGRENLYHTIAVENGLLMIRKNGREKPSLMPHTILYFSLSKLPFDYDPAAKCPQWEEFLGDVMQGNAEYILLLQQWAGYLLRQDLKEQRFLLCVGEGANGKGVFFETIQSMVGRENCSQVPISRFGDRFALYSTIGKTVNATNESSHIIADEAETILKSFVAGDLMTIEKKYQDSLPNVRPTAKIMISTNALPRFSDKTMGIWRRILLVPFLKVVPPEEQNRDLAQQLEKELPGILSWALAGLESLNSGGFITPEDNKDLVEEYRRDSDPCRAFLIENYIASANEDYIVCTEAYSQYKTWCDDNGCRPIGERLFGKQVKRIFPNSERKRRGGRNSREYIYQGLVSYEDGDYIGDDEDDESPVMKAQQEVIPF